MQLAGHVVWVPSQTSGLHEGEPAAPAERVVQEPSAVAPSACEQAWQAPEQAELQHTPSAQKPDVHWSFAVQDPARALFGTHWPLAQ